MARYRKIDPRFWKDEKIVTLKPFEKLIALYLFTSGQSNRIGIFSFSPGEACEDLAIPHETFREGLVEPFGNVCQRLKIGWDEASRVLYLPTWWKYNCPENPNVLKACLSDLHELPKTRLLIEFSENLEHLPETFHQTFREGLPKPSPKPCPNQEQEQEQEQEKDIPDSPKAHSVQFPSPSRKRKHTAPDPAQVAVIEKTVRRLNELSGKDYRPDSKDVNKYLAARLQDGATEEDCLLVVGDRWHRWKDKPEMVEHFNPVTLFRPSNFEKYLTEARAPNSNGGKPRGFVGQ
jgi:uncharacterized phage protein (TIGR02220 family)